MSHLSLYVDGRGRAALHRSGFSWLACAALPLWALHRRAWRLFVGASVLVSLLHPLVNRLIEFVPGETPQGLLALGWLAAWSALCGIGANALHRRTLERGGFRLVATEAPA